MSKVYSFFSAFALLLVLSLTGCATDSSSNSGQDSYKGPSGAFWKDHGQGEPSIVIDLSSQTTRFYRDGRVVGQSPVSTGREGYETPAGNYKILNKEVNHVSNLYGSFVDANGRTVGYGKAKDTPPAGTTYKPAPMPYFLRLSNDGTGMHAGFLPGYPASHGCIRMPAAMAERFFRSAPIGTSVTIVE